MRKFSRWLLIVILLLGVTTFSTDYKTIAVAKEVVIKVWDWQVMENYMSALGKILHMYEEKHPNVRIERKAIPSGEFQKQIKAAFAGEEAPDLFQVQHGTETEAYYKAGILYDFYKDWKADPEWQGLIDLESHPECFIEDKAVTFPAVDLWIHAVYYYKDMLTKYGLTKPETINDLINMVPVLTEEGLIVMSTAFGPNSIVWIPNCMWSEFMMQNSTTNVLTKLEKGELSWKDPVVKEALATIKKMKDTGVFPKDVNSAEYFPDVLTRFQNKKAWSFYIAGDWTIGSMNKEDVKNNNIGVMPLPKMRADSKLGYARAAGILYGMQPDNPKKETVIDLLKFFSSPEAVKVIVDNDIHPSSKVAMKIPIKNNLMKEVIKESENPNYWYSPWVIPRNPEISRRQIDDLGKLFLGMMTIDEVVEDLDKFTKEVLAR